MPDLTPTLPPRYRRLALNALMGLTARAKRAVASRRIAVEQLRTSGQETTLAQARLNLAERGLALLRGRQQFMQSEHPRPTSEVAQRLVGRPGPFSSAFTKSGPSPLGAPPKRA